MRTQTSPRLGQVARNTPCSFTQRTRVGVVHAAVSSSSGWPSSQRPEPMGMRIPNQADSVFNPKDTNDLLTRMPVLDAPTKSVSDLDYLSELLAIQQSDGPKNLGFFGTRNMGVTHQKLVEILAYAYASTGNHIFTSGATGTNAAVIKGALRANCPDKLTVLLPQSLHKQPYESQELLQQVQDLKEMPENDHLPLMEASRICNRTIISKIQQVVCFAFHDSRLLLETCQEAKEMKKIVTLFYLD
ncbi:hypothetical protein PLESTB_000036200 [Pleodorina starrii]|uniref:Uncharacterized protein n=1 Tax=Pleodorina starrii TaxID=330485 RepID=A0A9W6B975_9CHLO|nr:hypothetical protein PLESTM_001097900 [Pleodorina starrii]GLC47884.1 hypothetical protein PLESTB_000036200 [Pleodorina starrii]GLC70685.1 hypothetical protein PLESTF_001022300 [Pleodorina starrii]